MADPNSPVTRFTIWRASLPPAIRLLLTINVVTYLAFLVLTFVVPLTWMQLVVALPNQLVEFVYRPWTWVTHSFTYLELGFLEFIVWVFALAWLNWIGREIEETYGSHQILGVYVLSALGMTATWAAWLAIGGSGPPIASPWSAVGAIIIYAAVMNPNRGIGLFLIGVISLKWIAIAFVIIDLVFQRWSMPAHIGAYGAGFLFGVFQKRGIELGAWARPLFGSRRRQRPAPQPSYGSASGGWSPRRDVATRTRSASSPRRTATASRSSEPTQADIDRILEKIHEKGMDSLSKEEKRVLEKWSGQS